LRKEVNCNFAKFSPRLAAEVNRHLQPGVVTESIVQSNMATELARIFDMIPDSESLNPAKALSIPLQMKQ
jgi:hypothetical protein